MSKVLLQGLKELEHRKLGRISLPSTLRLLLQRLSRTQEFALLAYYFVQVPISQGWRRLPPQKRHPKRITGFRPYQNKLRGSYRVTPSKAVTNRFPQVGENRTTEASEVIFDRIQGDETPPPND